MLACATLQEIRTLTGKVCHSLRFLVDTIIVLRRKCVAAAVITTPSTRRRLSFVALAAVGIAVSTLDVIAPVAVERSVCAA